MSETHALSGSAVERLQGLGLDLPAVGDSSKYVNHRSVGSTTYVAGRLPYKNGELLGEGTLGRDVDLESGRELARHAALNALAVAADAVGGLDRVRVSCRCWSSLPARPSSATSRRWPNSASELLVDVLGENGWHARTAIGVAGLPRNSPVEIQMVCTTT